MDKRWQRSKKWVRALGSVSVGGAIVGVVSGCPGGVPVGDDQIGVQRVAAGIVAPVALVAPGDASGRLFVVSQTGKIHRIDPQGGLAPAAFLDIEDRVIPLNPNYDERGLLGLAFHPDYPENGRFFVYYVATLAGAAGEARVSEFRVAQANANVADADTERVLLRIEKPQANHNGGALAFGPDGMLYVSVGDGGGSGDQGDGHAEPDGNAQSKETLLGKILRIDVDGESPYAIPPDNPFADDNNARGEIYALGLRNPWRMSFDDGPGGSGRLLAGDVGQGLREEVDIIVAGGNYGWRVREGELCYNRASSGNPLDECPAVSDAGEPLIDPIIEYSHADGVSVIGGYVYRGAALPALRGKYVFGDYAQSVISPSGRLFVAEEDAGGAWTFEELRIAGRDGERLGRYVYGFGRDEAGELYVLTNTAPRPAGSGGEVWKIVPAQ